MVMKQVYQNFPFQGLQKILKIRIFVTQMYHLATQAGTTIM
jgi:hypothetical protein